MPAGVSDPNSIDVFNLELFFELSADLLCIAGYDGYFKRISPSVSKLLGYTNDDYLSNRSMNLFMLKTKKLQRSIVITLQMTFRY